MLSGDTQNAETVAEPVVDSKHAVMDDPIVGHSGILLDENGPAARQATPLASPPTMTPLEKEIHDLTHLPFDPACPICMATRSPNLMHLPSHGHLRVVPLLVADYCFMKFIDEQSNSHKNHSYFEHGYEHLKLAS